MTLRLRDTLSRSVLPVAPLEPGRVRMYSCGPTVYRYAHVGNLRTFLLPDLVRRVLLFHGLEVVHVQNITDVGHLREDARGREVDPMLVAAGLEGRSSREIADAYEAAYHADAALLNLLPAHEYPRATEHIGDMLDLAERLEDLGHAYLSAAGNLYYDVSSYPEYGRLSGNTLDALRAGHRGEVESDKRDPADFALWKAAGPDRELRWPSRRWGDGFPGWHLECSAMALRHLGARFDIHTGGEDNVFPHHEDEIAQSAPLVGGPPASLWVHGAHLLMSGRKMSKSAGNFQRVTELAEEGFDPLAFRYLCLTARYARKLNFSDDSLAAAAAGLESLRSAVRALGPAPTDGPWAPPPPLLAGRSPDRPAGRAAGVAGHGETADSAAAPDPALTDGPRLPDRGHDPAAPLSPAGRVLHGQFVAALDADLDLPVALRIAREVATADLPADERRWLIADMDFVLGLDLHHAWSDTPAGPPEDLPAGAAALIEARAAARRARDYASADRLRDELRILGLEAVDAADGSTTWRQTDQEGGGTARSARSRNRSSTR